MRLHLLFHIFLFGRSGRGCCQPEKTFGQHQIGQSHQRRSDQQINPDGKKIPLSGSAQQIQRIGRTLHFLSQNLNILYQRFNQLLGLEIDKIVSRQEEQRCRHRQDILVLQTGIDPGHHPTQKAGEHQNQRRNEKQEEHTAENRPHRYRTKDKIDNDSGKHHTKGEHRS